MIFHYLKYRKRSVSTVELLLFSTQAYTEPSHKTLLGSGETAPPCLSWSSGDGRFEASLLVLVIDSQHSWVVQGLGLGLAVGLVVYVGCCCGFVEITRNSRTEWFGRTWGEGQPLDLFIFEKMDHKSSVREFTIVAILIPQVPEITKGILKTVCQSQQGGSVTLLQ